jgi:hypothetical protein
MDRHFSFSISTCISVSVSVSVSGYSTVGLGFKMDHNVACVNLACTFPLKGGTCFTEHIPSKL